MCPRGLREIFNQTCRNDDWASSVSFRGLESSMSKRMKIQQPKYNQMFRNLILLQDTHILLSLHQGI